jgi:hypothetical protein
MRWSSVRRVVAVVGTVLVVGLLAGCGGGSSTTDGAQAQEQAQAQAALCSSLASLRSAVGTLTGLNSHASKNAYESAVAAVQTAWDQVAAEAKTVSSTSTASLTKANRCRRSRRKLTRFRRQPERQSAVSSADVGRRRAESGRIRLTW